MSSVGPTPAPPASSRFSYVCEAFVAVPLVAPLISVVNIFYRIFHAAKICVESSGGQHHRKVTCKPQRIGKDLLRIALTPLGILAMEARAICHIIQPSAKLIKLESFLKTVYGPFKI
jgi:hypothetical protein